MPFWEPGHPHAHGNSWKQWKLGLLGVQARVLVVAKEKDEFQMVPPFTSYVTLAPWSFSFLTCENETGAPGEDWNLAMPSPSRAPCTHASFF